MIESRFRVHDACFDVYMDSGEFIEAWLERWGTSIEDFQDTGCGCCVHILDFIGPEASIQELEAHFGDRIDRQTV
jgi:hypothetical protein